VQSVNPATKMVVSLGFISIYVDLRLAAGYENFQTAHGQIKPKNRRYFTEH
jgi:hypothetical protein